MPRGDTRPPRQHFAEDAPALAPSSGAPRRKTYACRAHQCPFPGTIFVGGGEEGICAYHFGVVGNDFVRVTQILANWDPIVQECVAARRFSNDAEKCGDIAGERQEMAAAWARLVPWLLGSGWKNRVAPIEKETYVEWGKRLEKFVHARVKSDLAGGHEIDENTKTVTVMTMHGAGTGVQLTAPEF